MGKLDNFRKILALPEVMQNVELTNQLRELQTDYFELLEKNNELNTKLREIGDISDIKQKAKVDTGFYTLDGVKDIYGEDICFCLNCLYEHNLQIPMNFGIVERGVSEVFSGRTLVPSLCGLSCHKCGTKIAYTGKGEKNNG